MKIKGNDIKAGQVIKGRASETSRIVIDLEVTRVVRNSTITYIEGINCTTGKEEVHYFKNNTEFDI